MGGRYAQALFDLATEDRNLSAVEADLKALKSMRASSKDFRTLLASPAFSAEEKGRAIAALADFQGRSFDLCSESTCQGQVQQHHQEVPRPDGRQRPPRGAAGGDHGL